MKFEHCLATDCSPGETHSSAFVDSRNSTVVGAELDSDSSCTIGLVADSYSKNSTVINRFYFQLTG